MFAVTGAGPYPDCPFAPVKFEALAGEGEAFFVSVPVLPQGPRTSADGETREFMRHVAMLAILEQMREG